MAIMLSRMSGFACRTPAVRRRAMSTEADPDQNVSVPVIGWHAKAATAISRVVGEIRDDHWSLPTPCEGWDVRALVAHVVSEARWTSPLLAGLTIEQVGDQFDGDLLGDDPAGSAQEALAEAVE